MKRNFAYSAVSVCSRLLAALLLFLLLARIWGPTQFGLFSFVFSVTALLALIVDFGFAVYLLREVPAQPDRAREIIGQALHAKLKLLVLAVAVALSLGLVIDWVALPPLLFAPLLLAAVTLTFGEFFAAALRALERFDVDAVVVIVANVIHLALVGGVAWLGGSPLTVAWVMVCSRLTYLYISWRALARMLPSFKVRTDKDAKTAASLRRVLPYGLDGMLYTALNQIDVVIVRMSFGVFELGLYSAGQRVVVALVSLAPSVGNVMIPRLTREAARRDPMFWHTAARTTALMAGVGSALCLLFVVFPGEIAHLGFGAAFEDLEALLPWFGGVLLARYVGVGLALTMTAAGLQLQRVFTQFLGLLLLVMAGLLVWLFGARMHVLLAAITISTMSVSILSAFALLKMYRRWITTR